jgi:hypothetical protein
MILDLNGSPSPFPSPRWGEGGGGDCGARSGQMSKLKVQMESNIQSGKLRTHHS